MHASPQPTPSRCGVPPPPPPPPPKAAWSFFPPESSSSHFMGAFLGRALLHFSSRLLTSDLFASFSVRTFCGRLRLHFSKNRLLTSDVFSVVFFFFLSFWPLASSSQCLVKENEYIRRFVCECTPLDPNVPDYVRKSIFFYCCCCCFYSSCSQTVADKIEKIHT